MPPRPSRRQAQQTRLINDIVDSAWTQLDARGPTAVTWRTIASDVEMSPASLYTYFDSINALFTHLITEAYSEQARCVARTIGHAEAANHNAISKLAAGIHAYRGWALRRPQRFRLLYDEQIPDYKAPEGGPTVEAVLRVNLPLLTILDDLIRNDPTVSLPDPGGTVDTSDYTQRFGVDLDPRSVWFGISLWASYHGLIQLEINNHLPPALQNTDDLFRDHLTLTARSLNLPAPADDLADLVTTAIDAELGPTH